VTKNRIQLRVGAGNSACAASQRYPETMSRALLACLLSLQTLAWCQDVHPVTGRQVAPTMGMGGAPWLVRPERAAEEAPEAALDAIGVAKGAIVADIGTGVGYFTWRLAERVGPAGKVYAEDIQSGMLEQLRHNMAERKLSNYEAVLGAEDDPRLPAGRLDLALLVDVYHEFSQPQKMLQKIRAALKPDGRLILLEYRKEDPKVPIRPEHKMAVAEVKAEIEPEGFRLDKTIETLPRQHILIFRKNVM
jgi:SAM-dependent methyltransferase